MTFLDPCNALKTATNPVTEAKEPAKKACITTDGRNTATVLTTRACQTPTAYANARNAA